ncbi:MAG TPA: HD domain-containing protein [Pirellulales bacterium]|nr:HD domain-containing protein [Pirellulales bacterium]
MRDYQLEALSHDPIHGYIAFTNRGAAAGETAERDLIDHPWVQRLRQIHQLQTAWWVFPSAEHTRFQHVLGVMHLASRAVAALYDSLAEVCPDVPSRGYVETLMRLAALLHDIGHGPFGHFFDEHFLSQFGLTHETLGSTIIREQLGDLLRGVRRNPNSRLADGEQIEPDAIAYLITRPRAGEPSAPVWLRHLRNLFSGLYTIDNMDFVLRDAYMSGYNLRAFDLQRLLHYSFFSERGLTVHARGLPELVRFIGVRAELFRSLYFHRTVRAIDLDLADLFADSRELLFPGNPLEHLDEYQRFTEWSLLIDVARWAESSDAAQRDLGQRWRDLLARRVRWKMACERTLFFSPGVAESSSIFSQAAFVERALRAQLPAELRELPLRVDLARHVHRPGTQGPAAGQNFLYDPGRDEIRELTTSELFRQLPLASRICRVYALCREHHAVLAAALDALVEPNVADEPTNM